MAGQYRATNLQVALALSPNRWPPTQPDHHPHIGCTLRAETLFVYQDVNILE